MSHLQIETSLQQLVHSHRREAAIGQEEGRERLVGPQVFFYWEICSGTSGLSSATNTNNLFVGLFQILINQNSCS